MEDEDENGRRGGRWRGQKKRIEGDIDLREERSENTEKRRKKIGFDVGWREKRKSWIEYVGLEPNKSMWHHQMNYT